jgi:hypothetical protein
MKKKALRQPVNTSCLYSVVTKSAVTQPTENQPAAAQPAAPKAG